MDLPPVERAELVERILASFEFSAREDIDAAWTREVEDRIDAFERGEIRSSATSEVFREIDRRARGSWSDHR
jgi:putative addiction module component (TIGR02574 family)